jgi:HSP20 family protein
MANPAMKKGEHQAETQGSQSTSLQRSGEREIGRWGAPSLFSLTPRDFFSASPFELIRRFTDDMDRLFEGVGSRWRGSSSMMWSPPIEISEKDGQLTVRAELPGITKEDVKVELSPEGLTISGERKQEEEERQGDFYRSERSYGAFTRTIPLPEDAQIDNAKATFENGVLTVSIPVPESKRRRREVPIEAREERSQAQSKAA